jgi:DNA-binding NtrC family response regulator
MDFKKDSKLEVGSKKILVVDDDEIILDVVSQLLSRLGYEVIFANNGDRGLDLFLNSQCGIVLTDFDMPGMDGITLAFHIKEKSPGTLVILMTGHDGERIKGQIKNSAVDLTLFKPFDLLTIEQILQETRTQRELKLLSTFG